MADTGWWEDYIGESNGGKSIGYLEISTGRCMA
jgi:hypothetical protein